MNIAYSCLGRSWKLSLDQASTVGGDLDRARALMRLAVAHPSHDFYLIGRNSGELPQTLGYPSNVINPWSTTSAPKLQYPYHGSSPEAHVEYLEEWERIFAKWPPMDAHVMWVGQHGGSNSPLPQIGYDWDSDMFTNPQMAFMNYCSYLLHWSNLTGIEPIALVPDPRNYWKARELSGGFKNPLLGQFNETRVAKYEQYNKWHTGPMDIITPLGSHQPGTREQSVWVSSVQTNYASIELTALDDPSVIVRNTSPGVHPFGIISNENRKEVTLNRRTLVRDWVLKQWPDAPVYGTWSKDSCTELGRDIKPVPATAMYDTLRSFRSTITLPASGSGWATAKPWECFAVGTVCFFHPGYDTQGHILPKLGSPQYNFLSPEQQWIAVFLRVQDAATLKMKVDILAKDDEMWRMVTYHQRQIFERKFSLYRGGVLAIEQALHLI